MLRVLGVLFCYKSEGGRLFLETCTSAGGSFKAIEFVEGFSDGQQLWLWASAALIMCTLAYNGYNGG
jgi:hypothetical protein